MREALVSGQTGFVTFEPIHVRAADLRPGDVLVRRGLVVETVSEPRTGAEGGPVIEVGYQEGGSNMWLAERVFEVLRIDFDDVPFDAVREVHAALLRRGDLLWHPHRGRVVVSVSEPVASADGIPSVVVAFEGGGSGVWSASRLFRIVRPRSVPVVDLDERRVALTPGWIWELTTEHGTRHLLDLRDGRARRMRLPAVGRPEHPLDGRWQGRVGIVHHPGMAEVDDWGRGHEVVVGEPVILPGPGFGDRHVTTLVVAVRALEADEIPPVVGDVAYESQDD